MQIYNFLISNNIFYWNCNSLLNHNTAAAYLVPVELFEKMMEMLDEHELENIVSKRLSDKSKPVKVRLDDL